MARSTHLAIVGAGPGGYAAAFLAADLGMRVTLIDDEPHPGGVCLYRGCMPSKALLHVARLLTESRQAREWGIEFPDPRIDLDKLRAWKSGRRAEADRRAGPALKTACRQLHPGSGLHHRSDHAERSER